MAFTAKDVQELRQRTGAGMMDCKKALEATDGNAEKATEWLREKGIATAAKKAGRIASQGVVDSYIHMGGKVGVLVEVNCETDFVAKGEGFLQFVHEVALQIAAAKPTYVSKEEVPAEVIAHEKEIALAQINNDPKMASKPDAVKEKIVEGKIETYYKENVLLEQAYVREPSRPVSYTHLTLPTIWSCG
ncbi:MAG: translation elongation factor Ts, partial [Firmicutes bacterium]|nr:translation elongation factor Ts [Candidatus Stercoripulliclostridium pullicola]